MRVNDILPTPLRTLKLTLAADILRVFRIPATYALRFIPSGQKRTDNRGRTVATYEVLRDALQDLHAIHDGTLPSKEPEHGSYYLAIEVRSSLVATLGAGRRNRDNLTVPLPLAVPERVSGEATEKPHAADAAQAAHDDAEGAAGHGSVHGSAAGPQTAATTPESVGQVTHKVDLTTLGMR